ncbi:MAG: rhodanese-like domain-containing protein [Bacteroidia bacterium]
MMILGLLAGAGLGFLYWKYVGCQSGACAITANKYSSMIMGALLGLSLAGNFAHAQAPAKLQHVNGMTFEKMLQEKNVVILDVRTPGEFRSGYIPGAVNIDVYDPEFKAKIAKLDKSKKYLVYCRSGARSTNAGQQLLGLGFTEVVNLQGGMMAWRGPVTR